MSYICMTIIRVLACLHAIQNTLQYCIYLTYISVHFLALFLQVETVTRVLMSLNTNVILIKVIETLELKPITINSAHHYIKWQYSKRQVRQISRVPEVLHNICNMCSRVLSDMSTLTLGHCMPSGLCVHIRQIPPAHVTYIT